MGGLALRTPRGRSWARAPLSTPPTCIAKKGVTVCIAKKGVTVLSNAPIVKSSLFGALP